jgi:hypothetical protein
MQALPRSPHSSKMPVGLCCVNCWSTWMGISRPASAKWKEKLLSRLSILGKPSLDLRISSLDIIEAVFKETRLESGLVFSEFSLSSFYYSVHLFSVSS